MRDRPGGVGVRAVQPAAELRRAQGRPRRSGRSSLLFVGQFVKSRRREIATPGVTYVMFGQGPGGTLYQTARRHAHRPGGEPLFAGRRRLASVCRFFSEPGRIRRHGAFRPEQASKWISGPTGEPSAPGRRHREDGRRTVSARPWGRFESKRRLDFAAGGLGFSSARGELAPNAWAPRRDDCSTWLKMEDGTVRTAATSAAMAWRKRPTTAPWRRLRFVKNALASRHPSPWAGPRTRDTSRKRQNGDLDGRVWRFDLGLDAASLPKFKADPIKPLRRHEHAPDFASMASVNVGGSQDYLFFASGRRRASVERRQQLPAVRRARHGRRGVQKFRVAARGRRRGRRRTRSPRPSRRWPATSLLLDTTFRANGAVHGGDREPLPLTFWASGIRHQRQRQRDRRRTR